MAKFGKKYRALQIQEWKTYYINYKVLKRKIKSIKEIINNDKKNQSNSSSEEINAIKSLNVMPIEIRNTTMKLNDLNILYAREHGKELEEFINILNDELNRCFSFYSILEKELYKKVNNHLYMQTNYQNYNLYDVYIEMNKLYKTAFLIKCLNYFIHINMSALKNILKKFDNKLGIYCGKIEYRYISYQLHQKNDNKLNKLLNFTILDEALTICESNLKELYKYFSQNQSTLDFPEQKKEIIDIEEYSNSSKHKNNIINQDLNPNNARIKIIEIKEEILKLFEDTDKLNYFKIQYVDWLILENEYDFSMRKREKFLENSIFNPILSAPYKNDDIILKFISDKKCIKDIEQEQTKITIYNKLNIAFVYINTFFYNTLYTCIYPLLFIYMKDKKFESIYSFSTIALTYFSSFFFMIIYHHSKIYDIKIIYNFSYFLCLVSGISYISSTIYHEDISDKYIGFIFILISRIFIGLGNNVMMGKRYIMLYSPGYYKPKLSFYYLIFQILGYAFGPFIAGALTFIPEGQIWKLKYNCFSCIGWYECVGSIILFILNNILFTRPDSQKVIPYNMHNSSLNSGFKEDLEDTLDKEFYNMKKEMINSNLDNQSDSVRNSIDNNDDIDTNLNINININKEESKNIRKNKNIKFRKNFQLNSEKKLTTYKDLGNINIDDHNVDNKRKGSGVENNGILIDDNKNNKNNYNPLLITILNKMENNNNDDIVETEFNKINMIPRIIDDIIRKEKQTFGYINHNLLMMFLLLFFNNMIKENYIAFFSYYITENENFIGNEARTIFDLNKIRITCLLTGCAYLFELISLLLIFPFHKINLLFKKYLIILMTLTNVLMIILSIVIYNKFNYPYFIILSLLILINMTLEVISSSYLAYLLPPGWKFKNIRAGALTIYIMTFAKICGILFCFISYNNSTWNYFGITFVIVIFYTSMIIYICKSPNWRIKSICRIIQMKKVDEIFN